MKVVIVLDVLQDKNLNVSIIFVLGYIRKTCDTADHRFFYLKINNIVEFYNGMIEDDNIKLIYVEGNFFSDLNYAH